MPTSKLYTKRYTLYAAYHGLSPDDMMEYDKLQWPGGCMIGFSQWIAEMKKEFLADNPDICQCGRCAITCNQDRFDDWLETKI